MESAQEHFGKRAVRYNRSSAWVQDPVLIRKIVDLTGAGRDSVVLDIATGTGLIAKELHGKVRKVIGLDISRDMAQYAEGCMDELVLAPCEKMPFGAESFDVCLCRQGLQFAELNPAIAEIYRVLKPSGTVVLAHLTAYSEIDRELTFQIQKLRNPARRNYLMPDDIAAALQKQGFRDVESQKHITEESVNQWIDNGAISKASMDSIRELYRSSDPEFRRIHRLRLTKDDIFDAMLMMITKASK